LCTAEGESESCSASDRNGILEFFERRRDKEISI